MTNRMPWFAVAMSGLWLMFSTAYAEDDATEGEPEKKTTLPPPKDAVKLADSDEGGGTFNGSLNADEHHRSFTAAVSLLFEQYRRVDVNARGLRIGYATTENIGGDNHIDRVIGLFGDWLHICGVCQAIAEDDTYKISGFSQYGRIEFKVAAEEDEVYFLRAEAILGFGYASTPYVGSVPDDLDQLYIVPRRSRTLFLAGVWGARFRVILPPVAADGDYGEDYTPVEDDTSATSSTDDFYSYGPGVLLRHRFDNGFAVQLNLFGVPNSDLPYAELNIDINVPLGDRAYVYGSAKWATSSHDESHQHALWSYNLGIGTNF